MPLTFRPATHADSHACFNVFMTSILDFSARTGVMGVTGGADPNVLNELWGKRQSLFEHLAHTAHQFWVAENEGNVIGYGRSILRDGVLELTEFFVLPGQQSAGVGRELLARAMPSANGARHRVVIATTDTRAQARYLKAGVLPRFPVYNFSRQPEVVPLETELHFEPMAADETTLGVLRNIDRAVLGHTRDEDHRWLMQDRRGLIYRRDGEVVGYGYEARRCGPFALLDERDFPAVLAHFEREAAARGEDFSLEVPMVNRVAVEYLLARGCQIDPFIALFMCDTPFGRFENYLFTSPPFFM
ncbi:MAG: GNAT family N-acetyltransferase [Anaerolineales bacterium]